jgi:branched-chain amino acid transport system permease protein
MALAQRAVNWSALYILRPLGQIFVFVVGSAVFMSVLALLVAFIFRSPASRASPLEVDLFEIALRQLPNTLVDGITIGFLYAVIALGYTMVYGVLKFINFAHSEIFMVGGVVGYEVMVRLREGGTLSTFPPILLIVLMIVASMVVCGLLAVIIERLAYKPLRNAPRLVPLIAAIGISLFLQDFVRAFEGLSRNQFNLVFPTDNVPFLRQRFTLGPDLSLSATPIIIIICAIIMLIGLNYFVNATRIGKGIRAVSQDQATASLMGINVNQMIGITFLVGGALGGAAGVLFGLKVTSITPYVGFNPGLKAFTAAVLGGIGNLTGALLGGIVLGLVEAFFSSLLPFFPSFGTGYSDIFAFTILILILIFRPNGLLGQRVDEKV